ncbi:MAG TPA: site-specific DNA-methyltransferase [Pseudonocardiaceae bacterium]|jgi:site-specific DNA-methyltransferase (adenine-specific)
MVYDPDPMNAPVKFTMLEHDNGPDYRAVVESDTGGALVRGDAAAVLAAMPDRCIQTVVTSPPYWSLRDYGIPGQVGLEESVHEFVETVAGVFDEVLRVLRDDGTLWLNIGDSYTSGGRTWRAPDRKNPARAMDIRPPTPPGLKPKDLIGVPWRLAFALQERGWYLRSDIVWNKPNCQPESVADRPTRSHEYLFLLTRNERYHYDVDAVRGPNGRRLRSVWDLNTQAYPEASGHFATFPPALVDPCLQIGSREGSWVLDPFVGSGTTALTAGLSGRKFVGIELNPAYLEIARGRLVNNGFVLATRQETEQSSGVVPALMG